MLNENRLLDTFRGHNIRPIEVNNDHHEDLRPLGHLECPSR